jgi:hypothetical protein
MGRMTEWADVPDRVLTPETITYELQRFNAEIYFSPEVLRSIRVETARHYSGGIAQHVIGAVATWRQERLLKVPANWWQHFKQRFYPKWALQRWPVLFEVYDAAVILPKVPVVRPEYHTVEFPVWQKRSIA